MTANEQAQLMQTIEMFEVITQSQPQDHASLEILKEAYFKLGRQKDVIQTSKRIAQAYVQMGQLSSAILEYESILQRYPDDPDVKAALEEIENRATNIASGLGGAGMHLRTEPPSAPARASDGGGEAGSAEIDDGKEAMERIFVEGKVITSAEFNFYWVTPNRATSPDRPLEPFIHVLNENGIVPLSKSLKLLSDKSKLCYQPLEKYDVDVDVARSFPRDACRRWCVVPFDRMSKSVFVATANPFNKQAALDLEHATRSRLIWYLSSPPDLLHTLRRIFR